MPLQLVLWLVFLQAQPSCFFILESNFFNLYDIGCSGQSNWMYVRNILSLPLHKFFLSLSTSASLGVTCLVRFVSWCPWKTPTRLFSYMQWGAFAKHCEGACTGCQVLCSSQNSWEFTFPSLFLGS